MPTPTLNEVSCSRARISDVRGILSRKKSLFRNDFFAKHSKKATITPELITALIQKSKSVSVTVILTVNKILLKSVPEIPQLIVLLALLQKLVGDFFLFLGRKFCEKFGGISRTRKIKAQKLWGKFRSIFREKSRGSKKIFSASFVLQKCHPK